MADPTEDQVDPDPDSPHGLRARLEEQVALRKEAEAKVAGFETVQRKLAVHEAGLGNLSEKQVKALFASHEGDTDAAALQATAKELFGDGISATVPPATPAATQPAPDAGLEQMERFGAGGQSNEPPPSARQAFENELANFSGTAAEYDEFIARNMEFLT